MRTEELMRAYQLGRMEKPDGGWEKIVWLAAEMIALAKGMRKTLRSPREQKPSPFTQDDLFNINNNQEGES